MPLVLGRKLYEEIVVRPSSGEEIRIIVQKIREHDVKLVFVAPATVKILRAELEEKDDE